MLASSRGFHFIDLLTPRSLPLTPLFPTNSGLSASMSCQPNFKPRTRLRAKPARGVRSKITYQSPHVTEIFPVPAVSYSNRQSSCLRIPSASSHMQCRRRLARFTRPLIPALSQRRSPSVGSVIGVFHGPPIFSVLSRSASELYYDPPPMSSADNVFIDSLPYYDDDLAQHPNLQALVDAEIARELKAKPQPNPATDPRLPPQRPLFKVRLSGFLVSFLPYLAQLRHGQY